MASYGARQGHNDVGIIVCRIICLRTVIEHLIPRLNQLGHQLLFLFETGVICRNTYFHHSTDNLFFCRWVSTLAKQAIDRKSTRLNSSHVKISYAVFCLKKKKEKTRD